jgi:nucleoside-diphosphate-sugar epimerase
MPELKFMNRAIISGITGHLGVELARQLCAQGKQVFGLTRQDVAPDHPVLASAHLHRIDGRTQTLVDLFQQIQPEAVFHLAGLSRRNHVSEDIVPFVEANILLGTQILEAMRLSGCGRIIIAGTYLQHFDTDGYRAFNLYAATKQAFEDLLAYYVDACGVTAVRLTLCDIYSEHDRRPKLMTDIADSWASSTPLHLRDARSRIDLIHVADAAAAFLQAARLIESAVIPGQTLARYSVSSGRDLTSSELVELFERVSGKALNVVQGNAAPVRNLTPWRGAGMPGWMPRISLEEGIVRILQSR